MPKYNTKYGVIELHGGYTLIGYESAVIDALMEKEGLSKKDAKEVLDNIPNLLYYWRQNHSAAYVAYKFSPSRYNF